MQASSSSSAVLTIPFSVNGIPTSVMLDSGAAGCFISTRFIKKHGIATRKKTTKYEIVGVNGDTLSIVDSKTDTIRLAH